MNTRTSDRDCSGFALLVVLWTLIMLSAVALALAATVGTEVRTGQDLWGNLQAERLAKSGHDFADYLGTRAIGTAGEDLTGLPVLPVIPGLQYRLTVDVGIIDVRFEGENGRYNLATASEEDNAAFLAGWTGDFTRGREIAASIADWTDTDDETRLLGAEESWYLSRGYRPRNSGLGTADLFLIKGVTPEDLVPTYTEFEKTPAIRYALTRFVAAVPAGNAVNPSYASVLILQSLPGMTPGILARTLEARGHSAFVSAEDFRKRVGLADDSLLLSHLSFSREPAPAILSIARLHNSSRMAAERRAQIQLVDRRRRITRHLLSLVEHTMPIQ